jgi:hypothetical protein
MSIFQRDCLSVQVPEVLLHIVSYLPSTDFLSLALTNKPFHGFFKANAKTICNNALNNNFNKSMAILEVEIVDGWFTPTHRLIGTAEEELIGRKLESCYHCRWNPIYVQTFNWDTTWYEDDPPVPSSCPTPHVNTLRVCLSKPGPQFLSFLEKHNDNILSNWKILVEQGDLDEGDPNATAEFAEKVSTHLVKQFLRRLDETGKEIHKCIWEMERAEKTRHDLLWYYGKIGVGGHTWKGGATIGEEGSKERK